MNKQHGKLKKRWIVLIVIAVLLLALALASYAVIKSYLGQIGRIEGTPIVTVAPEDEFFEVDVTPEPSPTPSTAPAAEPTDEPLPEPSPEPSVPGTDPEEVQWTEIAPIRDEKLINILLIGQDKLPGDTTNARSRSDSMILCSINPETGTVSLISFLRDLYVQIPGGYSDNRLNAAYQFGGAKLLDQTLKQNFGVSVDANIVVDMVGFESVIDLIGGVTLSVSEEEAAYMYAEWEHVVQAGEGTVDGKTACYFARIRKIDSDFGRTSRQREVLLAVYDKVRNLPVGDLLNLMNEILPYLTTDMTDGEILSLATQLFPILPQLSIRTYSVPSSDTFTLARIRGMSVLVPDRQKIRDLLETRHLPLS